MEADAAIGGGAQIVDIKDPSRGSLGCAGQSVIDSIRTSDVPVTAAAGECVDWKDQSVFSMPEHVQMAKLGLAGLGRSVGWPAVWLRVREAFDAARNQPLRWVAVAYVDAERADSPSVDSVAARALETDCVGLLLDTFSKQSGRLFDHITESELCRLSERLHAEGRFLAVAGRLRPADIERAASLPVDVVAVRSAACDRHDRQNGVTAGNVAACRAALRCQANAG